MSFDFLYFLKCFLICQDCMVYKYSIEERKAPKRLPFFKLSKKFDSLSGKIRIVF